MTASPRETTALAVVLAAGRGSRLSPLTDEVPKALVEVAGIPLLARLFGAMAEAGVLEVIVVAGYRRAALEPVAASWRDRLRVTIIDNPAWATHGNARSLLAARAAVSERGFLCVDGDLVAATEVFHRLSAAGNGSALAYDAGARLDDEAMKAAVEGGHVTQLGKALPVASAAGETIGAERIAAIDAPRLFDALAALRDADAYYEDAYVAMIAAGWRLQAIDVAGLPWVEVDDAADLARAEATFAG